MFFAPNFFNKSALSGLPVTAVTLYPILDSAITATEPTPPVAPVTKTSFTFSPSKSSSLALTANAQSSAVKPAVPIIILSFVDKFFGFFTKNSFLTFAN